MSVSKMKTVIILILVLMNLFLLMLVVPNFMPRYHQAQQVQTQLQTLFESYQLSLDLSTLPKSQPITSVNVSYDSDAALTAAKALLGDTVLVEEDPALYYSSYTSSSGTLRVYRSGLCDATLTGFDAVSDPAEHAQKLLTRMGLDICAITAQDTGTGAVAVTATQSIGGIPLDPAQIQLVYTDGCLTQLSGTLYLGTLSRPSSQTCLDCGADRLFGQPRCTRLGGRPGLCRGAVLYPCGHRLCRHRPAGPVLENHHRHRLLPCQRHHRCRHHWHCLIGQKS